MQFAGIHCVCMQFILIFAPEPELSLQWDEHEQLHTTIFASVSFRVMEKRQKTYENSL